MLLGRECWEIALREAGHNIRVLKDCLNETPYGLGRSVQSGPEWDDWFGSKIEMHSPLSLVTLMLGTNDFQFSHPNNKTWSAAQVVATLVNEIRQAPIEPGMPFLQF